MTLPTLPAYYYYHHNYNNYYYSYYYLYCRPYCYRYCSCDSCYWHPRKPNTDCPQLFATAGCSVSESCKVNAEPCPFALYRKCLPMLKVL